MLDRLQDLSKKESFFLFGPRGTGKSTLMQNSFKAEHTLYLDLLDPELEDQFLRAPEEFKQLVEALPDHITHVLIDEIQKTPKLLNVVHQLIEKKKKIFGMSGSSARKLKRGAANLLAGRAWVYHLYPFSFLELGKKFNLSDALHYGTLPKIIELNTTEEKEKFLTSYAHTYLKEEVWTEQFIRKLDPFRRFLEVSAQCNGKIINMQNIANDVGVDAKTVKQYFEILEDTMIGFFLEPFSNSFRKRLSQKPKFYYFDTGITRALARQLSLSLNLGTSAYGEAFEHYIILECLRLANYFKPEFRFSYLQTKDGAEVDLVIERPGQTILFIEIKSSKHVPDVQLNTLKKLAEDFKNCEAICFSNEKFARKIDDIIIYPWQEGIKKYFVE